MNLARWVEGIFVGEDRREQLDRAIDFQRSIARNNTQVVHSGARLIQHMSGMLQLVTESQHK